MPSTWPGLYADVDRLDISGRRREAARAEFESWARSAEESVLTCARALAALRASELRAQTAVEVVVEPRQGRIRPSASPGPVSLRLGTSRVHLYSVRNPTSSPCLHLGIQRGATSTRFPVFATLPGVLVVRSGADAFELLGLPIPEDGTPPETVRLEALVLRAFELLIGAYRSTLV
jgi:hypothetical protein